MKYLEEPRLTYWSNFLESVELGDRVLSVRTDAFSCKKAGDDKRLSKELDRHMREKLSASPASYGTSPSFGVLADASVRRTLVDLICTMNASFPDYDFSGVRPDNFDKEAGVSLVRNTVNAELSMIHNKIFLESFWADLDEVMKLRNCEVYTYSPDKEGDPFTEGCLRSFNYFFVNKALKRILFLHCMTKRRPQCTEDDMRLSDSDADDDDNDDLEGECDMEAEGERYPGDIMGDMDMESAGGDDDSMT